MHAEKVPSSRMPQPPHDVSRPVVVAVAPDGSEAALRQAATLAVRENATLHVVHVVDLTAGGGIRERLFATEASQAAESVLSEAVAYARSLVGETVQVSSELAHGDVVERIVAASAAAGVVILQQPPRPDLRSRGTEVCPQVAARAPVPVLCVPWVWNGARGVGTVTVGIDDPLTCGALVREALAAATSLGARLRLVHAESVDGDEDARRLILDVLADVDGDVCVVEASVDVVQGLAARVLREASRTSELLVVGRHHPHRPGGSSLGPVARSVVRRASCPVLLPTPAHSVSSAEWVFQSRWA